MYLKLKHSKIEREIAINLCRCAPGEIVLVNQYLTGGSFSDDFYL